MNEMNDPEAESIDDAETRRRDARRRAIEYARAHGAIVEENVSIFGGAGKSTIIELPENTPPEVQAEFKRLMIQANAESDLDERFAAALEYARTHGASVEGAMPGVRIGWPEDAPPEVVRRFQAILSGDAVQYP